MIIVARISGGTAVPQRGVRTSRLECQRSFACQWIGRRRRKKKVALSNVEEKKKSCSVFSLSLYFPCCMTLPHLNGKVAAAVARRRSHYDFKWMKSTVVLLFSHDRKSFPFKCNRRVNRIFGSLLPSPSPCFAPLRPRLRPKH